MCKKATWRFIIANIFANVFILVQTSQFPEFFDDDDLKSIGAKGHKSRHTPPATTGHYTDNMPGYVPAIPNDQNTANIPPNGMPVHYMPPQMLKKRPFKPIGRGDPSNQNIVEQMDEENDESIFPEPDGKPYGGHDFEDLDQLTNRLSKTNKWDEFKALLAQEGEQYKDGRIMKNWEDDAHMWASYSRHLLERTDHEQRKQADRQARPPTHHDPSIGLQQYWAEDTADQGPDRGPAESEGLGGSLGLGGGWSPGGSQGPSGGRGTGGGWGQGGQGPGGGWMGMGGPPPPNWKPGARRPSWSQGGPPGPGNGQGPGGGWGQGGPPGPSGGRGPDGGWGQGGPPGPGGGWGQGGPPGSGGDRGSGGPPGPGGGWGQGGPPGPGRGWGQGGPPGLGGGLGQGGPPGPTGGWGQGGPPGLGGGLGQGGPPGPAGRWSQGGPPGPGGGRGQGGPPGPGGGQSPGGGRGPGNGRGQSGPPGPGGGQGPVKHRRPPMTWIRRQMNDDMQANNNPDDYSDNLKGALDHSMQPPPLYYQGNNPDMPDFRPGLPQDKIQRGKDDRYLLPEQRNGNIPAEMNYPDVLSLGNLEKNLPPMPRLNKSTPFDKPERLFSPSINNDLIPGYTGGKMPGPGSESDYPNGYRPYGNNLMIPGMGSGPPDGGFGNFGMSQQSPRGSYPVAQKKPPGYGPQGKPTGLREGGGFPSSGDYSVPEGGPGDYPDDIQKALRMGGPGGFPSQPGPGSEGAFPQGFQPPHGNIQGGRPPWMKGGRPPGMLGGRSPNMQDNGPPNMQNDGPPGWGPESPPSLAGGFSPPGEPAYRPPEIEMPPGMPSGPVYPEYGRPSGASNRNPGYASDQQGFKPRNKYLPSGYDLMRIAKKQIAVQDYLIQRSGKMPSVQTTTEHIPTKQERIMKLRQFDDFHAPIRWVPLTSADTRDGLARVTDKESHKNQQFVIEGELYVPIVDERMSRLGWTTEDSNTTVTEITIKPPVDDTAIKVVMRSMNLNNSNELEWLAYETVLGAKHAYENECDGESCQARCRKTGCDCTCRGPGCFSMCSKLTCSSTVNGLTSTSNSTWDQMYPQYDHKYSNPDEVQPQGPAPGTVPSNDYYD